MEMIVSPALRRSASAVPSITGIRISPPGFRATLVNISASGLLAEWGLPLTIGQAVTVALEGTIAPQSVGAIVVRSSIASMTSTGLRYQVALAFTAPIDIEDGPTPLENDVAPTVSGQTSQDPVVNRW